MALKRSTVIQSLRGYLVYNYHNRVQLLILVLLLYEIQMYTALLALTDAATLIFLLSFSVCYRG